MAGPTIAVKLLGDISGLGKSFGEASSKARTAASNMHESFGKTIDALNQTGVLGPFGEALTGVNDMIGEIGKNGKNVGLAMAGIGAGVAGVGVALSAAGSKDQAAHQQLQAAVDATGKSYEDYAKKVEEAVKHQEHFGNSANETQDALRILTQATNDPAKALQYLSTATDLAAAKHTSLESAATKIGKAYNGNTRILKEFGIQVVSATKATGALHSATTASESADKALTAAKDRLGQMELIDATHKHHTTQEAIALHNAQVKVVEATVKARDAHANLTKAQTAAAAAAHANADNITALGDKLKGQGSAAADTFGGHLRAIKASLEDSAATIGTKYGPALTGLGTIMAGVGASITVVKSITEAFSGAQKAQAAATEAVTAAEDAEAVSGWLALGPVLLIIAAIAALVAIGYVLYRNWNTIWNGIKFAVEFVWNWIKANWPLLLGILLGPIALAVVLITQHWDQIKSTIAAAFNWIKSTWPKIQDVLTAPVRAAATIISAYWNGFTTAFAVAVGGIRSLWNGLWSFFTGLPGKIASMASGMWHGITDAFRTAINSVIDIWNRLHFTLPHLKVPGFTLGGETIGVPAIPHLAQGGLMTGDGLIYAHAGEVISPAPADAHGGPAVVVENAHFAQEIDVELFMRRAAWVIRTQAV